MMYDIIVFENFRFLVRPQQRDIPAFKRLPEPCFFWCPKTKFTCKRKTKTEKKKLRFQKCPDTCGRGLILRWAEHSFNRRLS